MDSPTLPTFTPRPYQELCIQRILEAFERCPRGGKAMVVIPTGGGKTVIFNMVIQQLRQHFPELTVLILAHRPELLKQAAKKYHQLDPTVAIGLVGDGCHEWGAPITVAMVQTLSRPNHLKNLKRFGYGLVIIDECHHSAADGYQAVLDALPDAFLLGVTATPDRLDNQSIERIFGDPVYATTILDLIEQDFLCDLKAIAVHTATSLDTVHTGGGDFSEKDLEEAIDTPERNQRIVAAYLKHCPGRQALCFAVTIAHACHLAKAFCAAGLHAGVVHGKTPDTERERILQDYERGALRLVCNVGVLTEGYDSPPTSCIIMARPTQSRALYVQMVGRGTRLAEGKQDCIILDVTDNCLKHRLQPQSLSRALGIALTDGESITQFKRRQVKAQREEQERQERIARVSLRKEDLAVDVLARLDWRPMSAGGFWLVVGEQKHRVVLRPSEEKAGYYSVWAFLAPTFKAQQWHEDVPLDQAQEYAERQVKLLLANRGKTVLVDRQAPWRSRPATPEQVYRLRQWGIPLKDDLTCGEASDLIGQAAAQRAKERAQRAAEARARATTTQAERGNPPRRPSGGTGSRKDRQTIRGIA